MFVILVGYSLLFVSEHHLYWELLVEKISARYNLMYLYLLYNYLDSIIMLNYNSNINSLRYYLLYYKLYSFLNRQKM
jgi:hypothetical protein